MNVIRMLAVSLVLLCSQSVFAQTTINVDTTGLSTEQKATIAQQIETMKAQSTPSSVQTAEVVDKWVTTGEHFGKMMGGAAKEVGMAANEFINTPVGKMVAFIIVWNYFGVAAVHFSLALLVLCIGSCALVWNQRRLARVDIERDTSHRTWFGTYPVKSCTSKLDNETFGYIVICWAILFGICAIICFAGT